jgi:hypothetical protein
MWGVGLSRTFVLVTGPLTYAAQQEHLSDLHVAAAKRRHFPSRGRGNRRVPPVPGLARPRRPLAA